MSKQSKVGVSYHSRNLSEQRKVYDHWANHYEQDLFAMGNRIPAMCAAVFSHHVSKDASPILDAGCGGGLQSEPLGLMGYGPIVGIDLSEGMLEIAQSKGIYSALHRMTMGEPLDFADNEFGAVICCGVLTPGHAPASSLHELIRVAKPGAPIVFSTRDDPGQESQYPDTIAELDGSGIWQLAFRSEPFQSLPYGEPEVFHRVFLYHKAG